MSKALVLIAPALLAKPEDTLARMRPLARFARYSARVSRSPDTCSALFASLGMAADTPIAPLALLGSGGDPADDYVLCAQPVRMEPGADHALDLAAIGDLALAEADTLVRMLDRHFAEDDLHFESRRGDVWFARSKRDANATFTPPEATRGRPLATSLPRGGDSARWKRWQDEIAMLLHDHPINREREAAKLSPVNAVWFFGGGRLRSVAADSDVLVVAPHGLVGDVALGLARLRRGAAAQADATMSTAIAEADRLADGHPAATIGIVAVAGRDDEEGAIATALAHLESGAVHTLHLIGTAREGALTWTATPPGWWRRQMARIGARPFAVPRAPAA